MYKIWASSRSSVVVYQPSEEHQGIPYTKWPFFGCISLVSSVGLLVAWSWKESCTSEWLETKNCSPNSDEPTVLEKQNPGLVKKYPINI